MYDDFDILAASAADPLIILANLREFDNLLKWAPDKLAIFEQPYTYSTLWHYLFRPSQPLQDFLIDAEERFGLRDAPYIGIHIRIGDRSSWWDPSRHSLNDVSQFLRCARQAEEDHFVSGDTVKWFLSTDSATVYDLSEVRALIESGKIVYLPSSIHVDRSDARSSLEGQIETQAAYMLLAKATAIVMSRSYFGETAAEIGPVKAAYFAPSNCTRTDLTAS